MQIEAGKLDWLKERKDFQTNPVARAATRLLEHQYMPHGEDLYPWILREIRRGNIALPGQYGDNERPGPWLRIVQMEMAAEKELARREHLINTDPTLTAEQTDPWHQEGGDIDWNNLENASTDKLRNFVSEMSEANSRLGHSPWEELNRGLRLKVQHPSPSNPEGYNYDLGPGDLRQWMDVLQDRAKRRQGVDPMQFSAPDLRTKMYEEWLPEHEERQRQGLGRILHTFPDKWTIRALQNTEEAHREGDDMGHCMGSYGDQLESGNTHLFSLRDPTNRPHASWEIKPQRNTSRVPASLFSEFGLDPQDRDRVQMFMDELERGFTSDPPRSDKQQKALRMAEALLCGGYTGAPEQPWHGGYLTQVQGKGNGRPIPEYQNRIRQWFGSMPEVQWPSNLEETTYHPSEIDATASGSGNLGRPNDLDRLVAEGWRQGPDGEWYQPEEGHFARTMEHYPAPAHKNRNTGRICHCPWGPERDLWSWNEEPPRLEDPRSPQVDDRTHQSNAVADQVEGNAAITQSGITEVKPSVERSGKVSLVAADGGWSLLGAEDVTGASGEGSNTSRTEPQIVHSPAVGVADSPDRLSATTGSIPAEVTNGSGSIEENPEVTHSRQIIADWDWFDEGEAPEDYLVPDFQPWTRGQDGKGLLGADGQILTWRTNATGDPHHDVVSAEEGFPYVAKLVIRPNGEVRIPSPDELHLFGIDRASAEEMLAEGAPKLGLHFGVGYTSKRVVCPTCGDPMQGDYGTFCPRCQWSEDNANLDHDPLSNPPDPTRDLHRGIQASVVIPNDRWVGHHWYGAVSDLQDGAIWI